MQQIRARVSPTIANQELGSHLSSSIGIAAVLPVRMISSLQHGKETLRIYSSLQIDQKPLLPLNVIASFLFLPYNTL